MTNKDTDLNSPTLPSTLPHRSALHSMLSYIQRAKENLGGLSSSSSREAEAMWFMKIAWNLALQCGEHYHEMSQLFTACHQVERLHTLIYIVTLTEHLYFAGALFLLSFPCSCWVVLPSTRPCCRGRRRVS